MSSELFKAREQLQFSLVCLCCVLLSRSARARFRRYLRPRMHKSYSDGAYVINDGVAFPCGKMLIFETKMSLFGSQMARGFIVIVLHFYVYSLGVKFLFYLSSIEYSFGWIFLLLLGIIEFWFFLRKGRAKSSREICIFREKKFYQSRSDSFYSICRRLRSNSLFFAVLRAF